MAATHAQIARTVVARSAPGVFARAALEAVTLGSHLTLERMLPGVVFANRKVGPDEWELVGTCVDGSTCVWRVGA
jgi:hypothetical protein